MEDNANLAADHAALRAEHEALQERLAREVRARDRERTLHTATAVQLARLRAEYPTQDARRPALVVRLRGFLARYPRIHRLLQPVARLAWLTVTLQLPGRIAARLQRRLTPGPPANAVATPRFQLCPLLPAAAAPVRQRGSRRMVCLTHVLPHPPRAGNEYRIARMLSWLAQQGWEVLLVVCPPVERDYSEHHVRQAAAAFPNLIVCRRDGTLLHCLSRGGAALDKLDGRHPRSFASVLRERAILDKRSRQISDILRTCCPDVLVELLLHLEQHFEPQVLLAEYVFMTRPFPLFGPRLRKVIDTIDVFSNKRRKVEHYGVADPLTLDESEETSLLGRADLLIAIQPDEAADLRRLAPTVPVVSVGVDFDIVDPAPAPGSPPQPSAPVILLVGSGNLMNVKGLQDFLRFAWPLVRRDVPDAELRVVGPVGDNAEAWSPGIHILGRVDDIRAAYVQARVVINPAVAGTGLKIKTVEALCHFRPIVLWPAGVEGLGAEARKMCHVANDWFDFAQRVIALMTSEGEERDVAQQREELVAQFARDRVYVPLAEALSSP